MSAAQLSDDDPEVNALLLDPTFDNVDWDALEELKSDEIEIPVNIALPPPPPTTASPSSPLGLYDSDDVLDEAFLNQLDTIEAQYAAETLPAESSTQAQQRQANLNEPARKRPRSSPAPNDPSKKAKSSLGSCTDKIKANHNSLLKTVILNAEESLTCAICCELFAAPQVSNPCGHTSCGPCIWSWITRDNKYPKTCPICRKPLDNATPLIPNFSADAAVEKHIELYQAQKVTEWCPGKSSHVSWTSRKQIWKDTAVARAAEAKKFAPPVGNTRTIRVPPPPVIYIDDLLSDEDEDDDDYDEGEVEELY